MDRKKVMKQIFQETFRIHNEIYGKIAMCLRNDKPFVGGEGAIGDVREESRRNEKR